jgi:ankyrin repeat protein
MSISDDAYDGSLTLTQLKKYLWDNPGSLDAIGGSIDLTPLCAACLGGHLQIVKHLLSCGADPNIPSAHECTPLFFATDPTSKANPATRCAVIRELVSGKNGRKSANVNAPCNDDKNTALMNVILELKDPEVMRQLAMSGASLNLTHYTGQKSAKELADEYDLSSHLESKADKDASWAKLIDLVVSFVLLVVAYTNNKTMNRVVGGVLKKYYDLSVNESDLPKVRL